MSNSTTNGTTTSSPATPNTPLSEQQRRHLEVLAQAKAHCEEQGIHGMADVPMYQQATPEQRAALEADMRHMTGQESMDQWEYLECLDTWGGDAASYLAESSQAPVDTSSTEDGVKAVAEKGVAEAEAELTAQREAVVTAVKAMVKSLRHGERALCRGYIDAGMYAHQVVQGKLALGDKRAVAVQLVEGQLALYASDTVDANRLIRCWAAYQLLVVEQGLEKLAVNVPYGVYRDAWGLLVERTNKDTAEESYVLLPGVEQMCKDQFKRATTDGLSKTACIEWAKVCQHEQLMAQTKAAALREAAAKQEREAAEAKAAAARKATQEAAAANQRAIDDAQQAKADEEQAAEAAKATQGAEELARHQEAQAEYWAKQQAAEKAKQEAQAKALADEKARLEAEDKARKADLAKREAEEAGRKQSEAEAKKAEQQRKAAEREANKGTKKAPAPGANLIPNATGTPKDLAEWMAKTMLASSDPDAVFVELLTLLIHAPTDAPVAAFKAESVQDAIMAAAWAIQDAAAKRDAAAAKGKPAAEQEPTDAAEPTDAELAALEATLTPAMA